MSGQLHVLDDTILVSTENGLNGFEVSFEKIYKPYRLSLPVYLLASECKVVKIDSIKNRCLMTLLTGNAITP